MHIAKVWWLYYTNEKIYINVRIDSFQVSARLKLKDKLSSVRRQLEDNTELE
jgi:hypothetical protein